MQMLEEARSLLTAAERLERDAGSRGSVTVVSAVLACVEQTLNALSHTCDNAVHSIVPPCSAHETTSARFARAADDWPLTNPVAAPSYEELARLMSSLHQAADALRIAAKTTARAREIVAAEFPAATSMRAAA